MDREAYDFEFGELPGMLAKRRANEGLSVAEAIRCLDQPRDRTRGAPVGPSFFKGVERAQKTMMSEVMAAMRGERLASSLGYTPRSPQSVAVWSRRGTVAIYDSERFSSDGLGWMCPERKPFVVKSFDAMFKNFNAYGALRHFLSPEPASERQKACSLATLMSSERKFSQIPEILLRWMLDSGASAHVISEEDACKHLGGHIRPYKCGYAFETANGAVSPDKCVTAWVQQLRKKAEFVILKDAPPILSLGKVVKDYQLRFVWEPDSNPYLYNPATNTKLVLDVENDTPMLPKHAFLQGRPTFMIHRGQANLPQYIAPAVKSTGSRRRVKRKMKVTMADEVDGEGSKEVEEPEGVPPGRNVGASSSSTGLRPDVVVLDGGPEVHDEEGAEGSGEDGLVEDPIFNETNETPEESNRYMEWICGECNAHLDGQELIKEDEEVPPKEELIAVSGCLTREQRLRKEAASLRHQMLHLPKNPYCKICQRGKAQRVRRTRKTKKQKEEEEKEPKVFS